VEEPVQAVPPSDRSLVSSRSSTPPSPPAPLISSDDERTSLLSGDDASSDDLDVEYVSALEVPETSQQGDGRSTAELLSDDGDVYDSTCDHELDLSAPDDDDDDDDTESSPHLSGTAIDSHVLQESSNSASTLLDDADELTPRVHAAGDSSSDDNDADNDADDDDDDAPLSAALLLEISDEADADEIYPAPGNSSMEPLLAAAGDSDSSDAN